MRSFALRGRRGGVWGWSVPGPAERTGFVHGTGLLRALGLFIFLILVGLYREWWVPGPFYRDGNKERDDLRVTNRGYEEHFKALTALVQGVFDRVAEDDRPAPPARRRSP